MSAKLYAIKPPQQSTLWSPLHPAVCKALSAAKRASIATTFVSSERSAEHPAQQSSLNTAERGTEHSA